MPQSNARMVRWDDGTWTLMIGEEALDVSNHDITANNQFLFVRHQARGPPALPFAPFLLLPGRRRSARVLWKRTGT